MDRPASDDHAVWRWQIGGARITRVMEFEPLTVSTEWLLKATAATALRHPWLQPHYVAPDGQLKALIQAFVVEIGGQRILIDPCVGNHKARTNPLFNHLAGPFLDRLSEAGFPAETIDMVVCTHLHVDHCGWNTQLIDGTWRPTFTRARHLFARAEVAHAAADTFDDQDLVYRDSIEPVLTAGLADLIEVDHQIAEGIWLRPTPGHTPAHCSVVISSGGHTCAISGDAIHHPLQACETGICSNFCWDDPQAIQSRRALLEWCAREQVVLIGSHFAGATAVLVRADGEGWRFTPYA